MNLPAPSQSPSSLLALWAIALLSAGCASSKLTLKLDIYGENPQVTYLTPQRLDGYELALKKAPDEIRDYSSDRQELAWHIYLAYETGFRLSLPKTPTDAEKESVKNRSKYWRDYTNELAGLTDAAIQTSRQSARKVRELRRVIERAEPINNPEQLTEEVHEVLIKTKRAIEALTGPMTNSLDKGLVKNFEYVTKAFEARTKNATERQGDWEKLVREVNKLDEQIHRLALKGSITMAFLAQAIDETAQEVERAPADERKPLLIGLKGQPEKVQNAIGDWTAASGGAPSATTNINALLDSLTPPRDHNDIEREQDPADPVWRTLSDPRNDSKWHLAFATNYFYSEGNNSVVVVRDTPMHYRIHSADNNPTALIEGQLRVSRALTDAAIQVAGTVAGVKMPDLKAKPPESSSVPAAAERAKTSDAKPPDEAKTVSVAVAAAQIEMEIAERRAALRALERRLTTLRADLERNGTNDIIRTNLLGQFESVIKAYSMVLKLDETKSGTK